MGTCRLQLHLHLFITDCLLGITCLYQFELLLINIYFYFNCHCVVLPSLLCPARARHYISYVKVVSSVKIANTGLLLLIHHLNLSA